MFLIASIPGGHRETKNGHTWGHPRLAKILHQHCSKIPDTVPVVAQSSSIGSLGATENAWISEILNSMKKDSSPLGVRRIPEFNMIYPSFGNVLGSHDGILGGGCLPYTKETNQKQPWLQKYLL